MFGYSSNIRLAANRTFIATILARNYAEYVWSSSTNVITSVMYITYILPSGKLLQTYDLPVTCPLRRYVSNNRPCVLDIRRNHKCE